MKRFRVILKSDKKEHQKKSTISSVKTRRRVQKARWVRGIKPARRQCADGSAERIIRNRAVDPTPHAVFFAAQAAAE